MNDLERGRELASRREDLIADGIDPIELLEVVDPTVGLDAVLEIHSPRDVYGPDWCPECATRYPCRTARAAGVEESQDHTEVAP